MEEKLGRFLSKVKVSGMTIATLFSCTEYHRQKKNNKVMKNLKRTFCDPSLQ